MPRLPAFRAAILILPIVLAALPARAAGRATHAMTAPGNVPSGDHVPSGDAPTAWSRTAGSADGLRVPPASEATGQAPSIRSPGVHDPSLHRFPRFSSRRTPSLAAPPPTAIPIERITISVNRPMHLADFILQTHSAFHLA